MTTGIDDPTELEELAGFLRSHPALRAKNEIRLVSEVLGAGSWVHGPGDDGAVVAAGPGSATVAGVADQVIACGECECGCRCWRGRVWHCRHAHQRSCPRRSD